jgi:hypothetical protein
MEGTWDPDNTNNWWWLRSPMPSSSRSLRALRAFVVNRHRSPATHSETSGALKAA